MRKEQENNLELLFDYFAQQGLYTLDGRELNSLEEYGEEKILVVNVENKRGYQTLLLTFYNCDILEVEEYKAMFEVEFKEFDIWANGITDSYPETKYETFDLNKYIGYYMEYDVCL